MGFCVLPLVLLTAACGYRGQRGEVNEPSYVTQTSRSTTVTVHPPPPLVSTTRTTSAELRSTNGPLVASARPDATGKHPDRPMSERIRRSLLDDKSLHDVALDRVRVVVVGSQVKLNGIVPTLADKVAIEQRVREVKGVEGVDNEIEVLR
jgi:osmotically-inducible protein OsmY